MANVESTVQRRVYRRRRNRTSNEHQQVNRCVPEVNQRPIETKTKQTNPTRLVVAWNKTSTGIELEYGTVWIELETRRRYTYEAASLCPQQAASLGGVIRTLMSGRLSATLTRNDENARSSDLDPQSDTEPTRSGLVSGS